MCTIVIEALTPLNRASRIQLYKNIARSRLFCRIAKRSILDFIDSKSGTVRKNSYRNQVDYVLIKNRQDIRVTNSRSYGGINTNSDHKLVLATVQTKWPYRKTSGSKTERIDYRKMSNTVKKEEYRERAEEIHFHNTVPTTNQQRWTKIVESSLEAAKEIFGTTKKKKFIEDNRLSELSKKQKRLRDEINSTKDKGKRSRLKIERNRCMADIQEFIKDNETKEVENKIEEIENTPKDSQKMFQVIKKLSKQKRVSKLLIESENRFTADEQKQADLVAEYFKKQFYGNAEMNQQLCKFLLQLKKLKKQSCP